LSRIHYKYYKGITLLARNLRKNSTPSEITLWNVLKGRKFLGYKFLRQHPVFYRIDKDWVEFFIADFYSSKLKLIIEVDGPIHNYHLAYDIERDIKLNKRGFSVKRIKNEELENLDKVISDLQDLISGLSGYR
jgi:very-short-patch-repair endonuclease